MTLKPSNNFGGSSGFIYGRLYGSVWAGTHGYSTGANGKEAKGTLKAIRGLQGQ